VFSIQWSRIYDSLTIIGGRQALNTEYRILNTEYACSRLKSRKDIRMKITFACMLVAVLVIGALLAPVAAGSGLPETGQPLTPEGLAAFVGLALSLIVAYVPWVKDGYGRLPSNPSGPSR
jgi:hypothetical protein